MEEYFVDITMANGEMEKLTVFCKNRVDALRKTAKYCKEKLENNKIANVVFHRMEWSDKPYIIKSVDCESITRD